MKVLITFSLDDERDREILRRLAGETNRSAAIRQALGDHYRLAATLDEVYRLLLELRRMGVAANAGATLEVGAGEEADLADALDKLGT